MEAQTQLNSCIKFQVSKTYIIQFMSESNYQDYIKNEQSVGYNYSFSHAQGRYQTQNNVLYITNFHRAMTKLQFQSLFRDFGKINDICIFSSNKITHPYAFVEYDDLRDAVAAKNKIHNKLINNIPIRVQYKKTKPPLKSFSLFPSDQYHLSGYSNYGRSSSPCLNESQQLFFGNKSQQTRISNAQKNAKKQQFKSPQLSKIRLNQRNSSFISKLNFQPYASQKNSNFQFNKFSNQNKNLQYKEPKSVKNQKQIIMQNNDIQKNNSNKQFTVGQQKPKDLKIQGRGNIQLRESRQKTAIEGRKKSMQKMSYNRDKKVQQQSYSSYSSSSQRSYVSSSSSSLSLSSSQSSSYRKRKNRNKRRSQKRYRHYSKSVSSRSSSDSYRSRSRSKTNNRKQTKQKVSRSPSRNIQNNKQNNIVKNQQKEIEIKGQNNFGLQKQKQTQKELIQIPGLNQVEVNHENDQKTTINIKGNLNKLFNQANQVKTDKIPNYEINIQNPEPNSWQLQSQITGLYKMLEQMLGKISKLQNRIYNDQKILYQYKQRVRVLQQFRTSYQNGFIKNQDDLQSTNKKKSLENLSCKMYQKFNKSD